MTDPQELPTFALSDPRSSSPDLPKRAVDMGRDTVRLTTRLTTPDFELPAASESDRALADQLLHLVSYLEQDRVQLEEMLGRDRLDQAAEAMSNAVAQTIAVARHLPGQEAVDTSLLELAAQARAFLGDAERFRGHARVSPWSKLVLWLGQGQAYSAKKRRKFQQLLDRGVELLEELFGFLQAAFSSANAATDCKQAYGSLLAELRKVAKPVTTEIE